MQPLQERVHYGFEYIGLKDPAQVIADELSENEVLERTQGVLDVVSVILYRTLNVTMNIHLLP